MTNDNFATKVNQFFANYEENFRKGLGKPDEVAETADAFADCFIEANPKGVRCDKNDEQFRKMLAECNVNYGKTCLKDMSIREIVSKQLDDFHYMAKVFWLSTYDKKDNTEITIEFMVIYFLQEIEDKMKIFALIAGDEQSVLKEHGLV